MFVGVVVVEPPDVISFKLQIFGKMINGVISFKLQISDQLPCQTLEGGKEVVLPWPVGLDPPHSIRTMVENVIVLVMIIFCAPKNHMQWE